jgi:hypothetical protein
MNTLLWTGESVWCVCTHHVEAHKTKILVGGIWAEENEQYYCSTCNQFTPYRKALEID